MSGPGSGLSRYWPTKWYDKWRCGQSNSFPLHLRRFTWVKTKKGRGVKSGRSGTLKLGKPDLRCKANKCSDAGTEETGVLTTHETSPCLPAQPARVNAAASIRIIEI